MVTAPVTLVTGSSSGIGAAVARRAAAAGHRVVVNSVRSADAGKQLAAELPDALYLQADIADDEGARALVDAAVEHYGRLDVVVNNAGVSRFVAHHDFAGATPELWRDILGVNVIGTWLVSTAAAPHLARDGGGTIVNISSIAGVRPAGSSIPYAVSKAAVNHMTRLLAGVLGPEVRVNAVAPGLVDTPWTAGEAFAPIREQVAALAPLRRVGTTDDVADAVWGLVEFPYTTGEVVLVDGGAHLR
ncbi:SDR family oxidoreductase [Yinghuangia sp. ASG 101]|uniref:SDR family NAD(P)-dependent oxidoreductase n=1 Tax=Yinghuangia sp. ASG 101 TaxID=2896848 RepID=UPI001E62FA01|nr:SDR family oxidoreductase [Yinghuangia sp. ASG 101]UGQ11776.1 SDR family oxidoreductase [Yinghuangia sp. ASG 101]